MSSQKSLHFGEYQSNHGKLSNTLGRVLLEYIFQKQGIQISFKTEIKLEIEQNLFLILFKTFINISKI